MLAILKRIFVVVLFENQRLVKFWAMLCGTFAGLKWAIFMNQNPQIYLSRIKLITCLLVNFSLPQFHFIR